jgi:hypothetical protein
MIPDNNILLALLGEAEMLRWHADLSASWIPHVFLKGLATDRWLRRSGASGDVDVLVPRSHCREAFAVLRSAGFRRAVTEPAATTWVSSSGRLPLDLHDTVKGAGIAARDVWPAIAGSVTRIDVSGVSVPVLGSPARELILLLHVALGGGRRAESDLLLALDRTSLETWQAAVALATVLGAERFVAMALSLNERTCALGEDVGVTPRARPRLELGHELAIALLPVLAQRDPLERMRLLGRFLRVHPAAAVAAMTSAEVPRRADRARFIGNRVRALPAGMVAARKVWVARPSLEPVGSR